MAQHHPWDLFWVWLFQQPLTPEEQRAQLELVTTGILGAEVAEYARLELAQPARENAARARRARAPRRRRP